MAALNLVVLRLSDLERAARFYAALGVEFVRERHGTGPEHLAGQSGTAGAGVAWLHVRLDDRPKYYEHAAYRTPPR